MNQSSPIANAFPFLLLISTTIIFFTAGFLPAIMCVFGSCLAWFGSYSTLTALIYSRGSQRVLIIAMQAAISYGGYLTVTKANFMLNLFGLSVDSYNFAYFSVVMGLLMAITTTPYPEEIERSQKSL